MYSPTRLIGNIATRFVNGKNDRINLDINRFVYNILFSDHFILDSIRLREISFLVRFFGFYDLKSLLLSDNFSIFCETHNFGIFNLDNPHHNFLYQIQAIEAADRDNYLKTCLDEICFNTNLDGRLNDSEKSELVEITKGKIVSKFNNPLKIIADSFFMELEKNHLSLTTIIQKVIQKEIGLNIPEKNIEIEVIRENWNSFFIQSNIQSHLKISKKTAHKIIGKSILALGKNHIQLFKMNDNKALGCYRDDEIAFFSSHFKFLESLINKGNDIDMFQRVIKLAGLPQLDKKNNITISKIQKLKKSSNYQSFKEFLNKASDLSDEEIQKEFRNKASKLFAFLSKPSSKFVGTIITSTAASYLPGIDTALSWILKKLSSKRGHVMFLYNDYPSIFK